MMDSLTAKIDCFSSEVCAASFCPENDLGTTIDDVVAQAGLEGITLSSDTMDDTFEGTCGQVSGGVDVAYSWEVPQDSFAKILIRHRLQIKLIPFSIFWKRIVVVPNSHVMKMVERVLHPTSQQNLRLVLNMLLW